ncbi:LamG domain-containing protein [Akkermansiaceae bacterium]|nr:LamG domain-containing protein [Akkermansiaceae bacterium]
MMKPIFTLLLVMTLSPSHAATLANRWSFDTDTTDSVGGNTGVLIGGATVDPGRLSLTGLGTGTTANHMTFTTPLEIGVNYGTSGVTIETWYTDTGTGTWGKLFHFGTNAAGQEIAYTHSRGNGEMSGVDRDGAKILGEQVTQNEEHHLVITVTSDGNLNAWVDGVKKLTDTDTNDLANVTSDFEGIGATSWNDPGMTGSINEFRIWSGALTDFEVEQSFTAGPDALPDFGDSDGDGIQDAWELAQTGITDLTQLDGTLTGPGPGAGTGDFDGDGLFDLEEYLETTDPVVGDTDTDGLLDGPEVKTHFTDPLVIDSDGDTLSDGVEINTHGTNPNLKDSDMDFIDDNVEIGNGTSPTDINDPGLYTGTELVHRWSFTTGANQLADTVGGNTAVLFGDPEFTGNQIIFDGLETGPDADSFGFTNLVDLGNNFGTTGVTIESWYTDSGSGGWAKLFAFGNGTGGANAIFNLQRGTDNVSSTQYPQADFSNETRPTLNEEHHLTLTITPGGEVNAWVDGVHMNDDIPLGDGDNLGTLTATWERVGASAWGDAAMLGSVNEFRIWKGTHSSIDVASNFALGPDSLFGGDGLEITSISRNTNTGAVTLIFNSIPGRTYRIDSSPTLVPADSPLWIDVDDSFLATENVSTFTDSAATGTKLFYRIQDVTN